MLLNTILTSGLPSVVSIREEDGLASGELDDRLEGDLLRIHTRNSVTIGTTSVGPTGLQVVVVLARADFTEDGQLRLDELTSQRSGDLGVEVGVQIGANYINGIAQRFALLLPGIEWLRCGDSSGIASALKRVLGRGEESSELPGGSPTVLNGLVTDDDELDQVPLGPGSDVMDLFLRSADAAARDVHTQDQLQAMLLGSFSDVFETLAVRGVDTDGIESPIFGIVNVGQHASLVLAATLAGVG